MILRSTNWDVIEYLMKTLIAIVTSLLFTLDSQASDLAPVHAKLQMLFDEQLLNPKVHSASWAVFSPSKNIEWNFTGGKFKSGEKISQATPFYTASLGKTFTATAIAMLYEQGLLNFNEKISQHLPNEIVSGIHIYQGKDYSNDITIAQLLQHTTGLPDYFEGDTTDGSANAMSLLGENTERFWTPNQLLNLTKKSMVPLFKPGASYQYSDTGYILLGLIVEHVSGDNLHDFFKQQIFKPLKMNSTYMHLRGSPILMTDKMAELYVDNLEISSFKSLSLDWAGGGLVSTAQDINKFQLAFHTNRLLKKETLKKMQQWIRESKGLYYGFGLRKVNVKERFSSAHDFNMVGHTGSTSSFMFYCPELDIYLSGTFNQTSQAKQSIIAPVNILFHIQRYLENEK